MTARGCQNGHKINVVVLYDFVMIWKGQQTMRRTPERLICSGVLGQLKRELAVSLVSYANALIEVLVRF
ncbi:hypothetical protein D8T45_12590 [Vibrio vulnificus]|nr:hypothetical protein D8T45_12590 [Vibrio vulnificus]RZR19594.1 hypothetical protein D8T24_03455 [Vibrio vulnificus]